MLSRGVLIAAAILALLAGLVSRFPARIGIEWLVSDASSTEGVTGSIWQGEIASLTLDDIRLAPIRWRLSPWRLLTGNAHAAIEVRSGTSVANAIVTASVAGTLRASNATVQAELEPFTGSSPIGPVRGRLDASIAALVIEDGFPTRLVGTLDIRSLEYPPIGATPLGDYRLDCNDRVEREIHCDVTDAGGPLEVSGALILRADSEYVLTGLVRARPGAPPALSSGLRYLGRPDAQGRYPIDQRGRLHR